MFGAIAMSELPSTALRRSPSPASRGGFKTGGLEDSSPPGVYSIQAAAAYGLPLAACMAARRKHTAWARVQISPVPKQSAPIPAVTPFS